MHKVTCPTNPKHKATRVHKTAIDTCFCVCDECGATWNQEATSSEDLAQYCRQFADDIDSTERVTLPDEDGEVLLIDEKDAEEICATLRRLSS